MTSTRRTTRTALAALAAGALAAGGLAAVAAPAQATTVFSDLHTWHNVSAYADNCILAPETTVNPGNVPITANVAKTTETSITRSGQANADPADLMTLSSKVTGLALATTNGSLPKRLQLNYTGYSKAVTTKPTSSCEGDTSADIGFQFRFTTTVPLWATLSYTKKGSAYVEAYLEKQDDSPYEELYGRGLDGAGSTTVLITPGEWSGYVEGSPYLYDAKTTKTLTSSGVVSIDFARIGSAISGPSGAAQGYAKLASARGCSTHALPAKLTTSSKRIKQVKKIAFSVNGKTVKTLKGKALKRGATVNLKLRDSSKASVKTTVTLKNGKKRTAQASYRACTS